MAEVPGCPLIWKLLFGLIAGVIAGLIFRESVNVVAPLGDLFLRLLSMLILPLVLTTLLVGITSISAQSLGRVGGKTFGLYLVTTFVAIIIGIGLALLVSPGRGLDLDGVETAEGHEAPDIAEVLLSIFPNNIFDALSSGQILAVLFVTLIVGFALNKLLVHENPTVAEGSLMMKKLLVAAQDAERARQLDADRAAGRTDNNDQPFGQAYPSAPEPEPALEADSARS